MLKVNLLPQQNSILNQFLSEMRNVDIQTDMMRFRKNMERIGEIFAYEISKTLEYKETEVVTPLGVSYMNLPVDFPVLASILRAGLPFHQGFLNFFDRSSSAFISAYRKHHKDNSFTIKLEYISSPSIENKVLILIDPMLATGSSILLAYNEILQKGTPIHTHIATIIASIAGIDYLKKHLGNKNVTIWTAAIDEELTAQAYIVPGLGDAGDLAFGSKE